MELLPLVLIIAVFYLFIIRPQRNRARDLARVQGSLAPGQQVMTGSGLYATIAEVDEDQVVLEVAPGVRSRYARQAVLKVVHDPAAPVDADPPASADSVTAVDPEHGSTRPEQRPEEPGPYERG